MKKNSLVTILFLAVVSTSAMAQGKINILKADTIGCNSEARGTFRLLDLQSESPRVYSQRSLDIEVLDTTKNSITYKVIDKRAASIVTTIELTKVVSDQNSGVTSYLGTLESESSSVIAVRCTVE